MKPEEGELVCGENGAQCLLSLGQGSVASCGSFTVPGVDLCEAFVRFELVGDIYSRNS